MAAGYAGSNICLCNSRYGSSYGRDVSPINFQPPRLDNAVLASGWRDLGWLICCSGQATGAEGNLTIVFPRTGAALITGRCIRRRERGSRKKLEEEKHRANQTNGRDPDPHFSFAVIRTSGLISIKRSSAQAQESKKEVRRLLQT